MHDHDLPTTSRRFALHPPGRSLASKLPALGLLGLVAFAALHATGTPPASVVTPAVAATPKPKPTPCAPARWVVSGTPLVTGAAIATDALVLGTTTASVESGCAPVEIKPRASARGTRVSAKWTNCSGLPGTTRLTASIDAACTLVSGKFANGKAKVRRSFTATKSSCGDGVVDTGGGEECDGGAGCAAGSTCTASCTCESTAPNQPPVAGVAAPIGASVFEIVLFDGTSSTDPDGDPLVATWDFGDGTAGAGLETAHAYAEPGVYSVRLTVGDGRGGIDSAETTVSIAAGPAPGATVPATGRVRTVGGAPLGGVTVSLVGSSTTAVTNFAGEVTIDVPTLVPVRLQLGRYDHAEQVVEITIPSGSDSAYFERTLQPREASQAFDSSAGGSLDGKDGARVTFPAGGVVDSSGAPFVGTAFVAMTPVDPTQHPDAFPGSFAGYSPGLGAGLLLSYGTVEFVITDSSGNRLNLAPGNAATIEIPIYASVHPDGTPILVGDVVPLWTLDERTGTWIQEGTGIVVAAASSPSGLALRATVSHFSWFNCDAWIGQFYYPKPKCLVDTNFDGVLEDLTGTGYCWHAGTGPEQPDDGFFQGKSSPSATTPSVFPAFAVQESAPSAGGTILQIPAGIGVRWRSTALNGLLASKKILRNGIELPGGIVSGPSGVEEEIVIVLEPVANGPATPITLPHDATYTLLANEPQQFRFDLAAGAIVGVGFQETGFSQAIGTVIVLGPGGVTFGPWNFLGSAISGGTFTAPTAGEYRVVVNGTGTDYRLIVDNGSIFPLLVSSDPVDGATGVARSVVPSFTFSRSLDPVAVTDANFWIIDPTGRRPGTVVVSGSEVSITPDAPLPAGTSVSVIARTYPPFLADNGVGLVENEVITFQTVDLPLAVSGIGRRGQRPVVAVRPDGTATAHWQNRSGENDAFRPGGSFSAVEAVYAPADGWSWPEVVGERQAPAALAVNASGEMLEILRRETSLGLGFDDLAARRQTSGAAWGSVVAVENLSAAQASTSPDLAAVLDDDGNATVAWFEDGTNRLWVNRWPAGGTWGTPVEVSSSVSSASGDLPPPSLSVNHDGYVVLGWVDGGAALVQRHLPGFGWTSSEIIAAGAGTVVDLRVAIDVSGNVVAVFNEGGTIRARLRSASTGTWGSAVDLGSDTTSASGGLRKQRLALGISQLGVAFMAGIDASTNEVYARRFAPDGGAGTWESPVTVLASGIGVEVGVDAAGNAIVAARSGVYGGMTHREFTTTSGWLPATGTEVPSFFGEGQWALAMGADGPAVAVADDESRIQAAHF
ncbi:PKD domain-containing protein [bacterium]|nr:PKD domain-containing protein [bacterium]